VKSRSLRMIMALCLCFTLVFPTVALGAGTKDFSDTKGHWAVSEIGNLAAQGYINGYPDGTFKPDSFMTKAEFTTALIGCLDITPSTPTKNSFSDTKTHWARKYIEEAVARGILVPSESPNGFGPDQDILRSQATAMIVRALALKASSGTIQFTDRDDVERSLYRDHIKAAYDAGIIKGFSDGSFAPYREMTRAQVCTVLVKKIAEGSPNIVDLIRDGKVDFCINTWNFGGGTFSDGFKIRRAAVELNIPCLTSLDTVKIIQQVSQERERWNDTQIKSLQEYVR
jgi:hypothetical protein